MANRELSVIPITKNERIVLRIGEQRNVPIFDVRKQARTGGRWFPTRDGFSAAEETLRSLRDAIDIALDNDFQNAMTAAARAEGLIP